MRTSARWALPAAVAAAVAGGSLLVPSVASASPALPPTTAAALLRQLAAAPPRALSGTVVQTTDLGLPKIPTAGAAGAGADPGSLTDLLAGSTKARVWTDGAQRSRVAVLGNLAETDVVRAGADVWTWRSGSGTAQHAVLPGRAAAAPATPQMTPDQAAGAVLGALDPTTRVSLAGTSSVAGRDARLLVLQPRDTGSLVGRVVVAVDAATSTPLRVQVFARGAKAPAVQTGFTDVSFTRPSAHDLTPGVPAGTKVQQVSPGAAATGEAGRAAPGSAPLTAGGAPDAQRGARPTVVGTGWTSVLVAHGAAGLTAAGGAGSAAGGHGDHDGAAGQSAQALQVLQQAARPVSGAFGSGRLLTSALVSVLVLDDGRVLVGAVDGPALEKAALDPAAKP